MKYLKANPSLTKTVITVAFFAILCLLAYYSENSFDDSTTYYEEMEDYSYNEELDSFVEIDDDDLETPEQIEAASKRNALSIGETANFNGIEFTLDSAYKYEGGEYDEPDNGMTFLVLDFTIRNNTPIDYDPFSSIINLYADGKSSNEAYTDRESFFRIHELLPDTYGVGSISYEIPENATEFKVTVTPDYDSKQKHVFTFTLN